jgi:hypothetical protein
VGFYELPWDSMRFHGISWSSMRFYDVPVNQSVPTEANRGLNSYNTLIEDVQSAASASGLAMAIMRQKAGAVNSESG